MTTNSTPWGPSHRQEKIAPGITRYSTGSHGGYHLSPERLAAMPEYMRPSFAGLGWYEEDCDWCIPVLCFEAEFRTWAASKPWTTPDDLVDAARRTLERWHPEKFRQFFQFVPAEAGINMLRPVPAVAGPVVQTALF